MYPSVRALLYSFTLSWVTVCLAKRAKNYSFLISFMWYVKNQNLHDHHIKIMWPVFMNPFAKWIFYDWWNMALILYSFEIRQRGIEFKLVQKVEDIGLSLAEKLVPTRDGYKTVALSSGKVGEQFSSICFFPCSGHGAWRTVFTNIENLGKRKKDS